MGARAPGRRHRTSPRGIEASYLAVVMGTSIRELEDTYFRWLKRTDEQLRATFDAYDARAAV
jgi:hypothetical protein